MNRGFWDKLNKPIMALAPMADVTDAVFRRIIAKYGKPDITWTEFVSVDGLCSPGKGRLMIDFKYGEEERPIVAQIFGAKPENFYKVAKMLQELKFDGIDINMGCPVKKVINQESCSALIRTPTLAQEIILATKEGAGGLPVSVKTRIGFYKQEIDTWIPKVLETNPAALIVHLRTVREMSKVPAHWELMPKIVEMVKTIPQDRRPLLLGNGDVLSLADGEQKIKESGCDGVMLGRAIFGNPWLFNRETPIETIPLEKRFAVMLVQTFAFEKEFMGVKNFELMKKHYKAYVNGFDGAKEFRTMLMEAKSAEEIKQIVFEHYPKTAEHFALLSK